MKLNISYPATGCQKLVEIVDEHKLRIFYDKRMGAEVQADSLGDEWKGYIVKITGGNDKQGFPMKQGVLTNGRVRLLLSKGHSCYRPRRDGERKRKSVRGCIVDSNLSVLALVIKKKGEQEIPGLTDTTVPRRLGPKRASKIRKLFNLSKEDDVRQFVIKRPLPKKEGQKKQRYKSPKIQRLITPAVLQRKRRRFALIRRRVARRKEQAAEYAKLLAQRQKEAKAKHKEEVKRRRSASLRASKSSEKSDAKPAAPAKPAASAKPAKTLAKPTKPGAKPTKPGVVAKPGAKVIAKPGGKVVAKPGAVAKGKPAAAGAGKQKPTATGKAGKVAAKPAAAKSASAKPAAAKPSTGAKTSSAPKTSSSTRPPFAKTSLAAKSKAATTKPSKPAGKPAAKSTKPTKPGSGKK